MNNECKSPEKQALLQVADLVYARLGAVRDKMPDADVLAVQNFLDAWKSEYIERIRKEAANE